MLRVKIPSLFICEQRYALDILLTEFLGITYRLEYYEGDVIEISVPSDQTNEAKLTIDVSFFHQAQESWLKNESLPDLPLKIWKPGSDGVVADLVDGDIPVLFGRPGFEKNGLHHHLSLDIFGSAFFMLSRYEELVINERDIHDRFPATASVSFKGNFLHRPLIDEYLEILWYCLAQLWPGLKRQRAYPQIHVSCDVDQPYDCTVESLPNLLKACAGDILKRKSPPEFICRLNRYLFNKMGVFKFDLNYTFDWYLDECEKRDLKAAFYFIPTSIEVHNACYELSDNKIIRLMQKIDARGHEIGVHGSYQTYQDKTKIVRQKVLLETSLKKAGIRSEVKGNRQHYLRWDSSITPEYLDAANFEYDSTGAYADRPGFRFGTSKEFSMWGWQSRRKIKLKQRPLILMEGTIISESYMGLGYSQDTLDLIIALKKTSLRYGGNFSFLWHNSELRSAQDRRLFVKALRK